MFPRVLAITRTAQELTMVKYPLTVVRPCAMPELPGPNRTFQELVEKLLTPEEIEEAIKQGEKDDGTNPQES